MHLQVGDIEEILATDKEVIDRRANPTLHATNSGKMRVKMNELHLQIQLQKMKK